MGTYGPFFKSQWKLQFLQTKEWFYLIGRPRIVRRHYLYLLETYKILLKSLKEDFYKHRVMITNHDGIKESLKITKELDDLDFEAEKVRGLIFPWRRRYYYFRALFSYTGKILKEFEDCSEGDSISGIDVSMIKARLAEMEPLVRYYK